VEASAIRPSDASTVTPERRSRKHTSSSEKIASVVKATEDDFLEVRWLFDTYSSGVYGFVPESRIHRHIREGACHVIKINGHVAAAAIGKPGETLWNIMVRPEYRHLHLGTLLVTAVTPERIRVKCRPHKGMSDKDLAKFTDPTPFYERMGYVFEGWDHPRNFYLGRDRVTGKGKVIGIGEMRTVKIMRRLKPGEKAPEPDRSVAPRVTGVTSTESVLRPRVRC